MNSSSILRRFTYALAAIGLIASGPNRAQAAFHLWDITEIYSNSSGTLQFIEFFTSSGSQEFVGGQQITIHNIGDTIQHSFTIPSHLPSDSTNKRFLLGTSGIAGAGGPTPDYIIGS